MLNETFKLQSVTTKYVTNVEEKTVCAYCTFTSILGQIKATGYAYCGDLDKFDKYKGRQLARARAELNAYAVYRERLYNYQDCLNAKFNKTTSNLSQYIEHQILYIDELKR